MVPLMLIVSILTAGTETPELERRKILFPTAESRPDAVETINIQNNNITQIKSRRAKMAKF
jgi:hypothetical protein